MKRTVKKETIGFSFSYLDVFFLLILGLILSVFLYFVLESPAVLGEENAYQVELSAYLDKALLDCIPAKEDVLFDKEGREIGQILAIETEVLGSRVFCKVSCRVTGSRFQSGEKMTVETQDFTHDMWIYSVKAEENFG